MARTFVVGLDGASWKLLDPWLESGKLPNISQLKAISSWSKTNSCLPPVTFPNWKCYSSGKNPGGFGVFWFEKVDLEEGLLEIATGEDFKTAELWDYLNDCGRTTGIVNMPTMYPPRNINGPIVCGGPDAIEGEYRGVPSNYTSPQDLQADLQQKFDYRVHPEPLITSNSQRGAEVDEIINAIDTRFEVALSLFEENNLDFMHVTIFYINVLHHFFWNDKPTLKAWKLIDDWIGKLSDKEDLNLVLMSDHGSAPTTTEFYINEWLAENGYQSRERTTEDALQVLGFTRENVLSIAKQLGVVNLLSQLVPRKLQQMVPKKDGAKRERKLASINLENTMALASAQGPIYLNILNTTDAKVKNLINDLKGVQDDLGPIFKDIHRAEEIYSGPYVGDAPEIIVDQRTGVHVNDGIGSGKIMTEPDRWAAENTPNGIFLASGPDFSTKKNISDVNITDIAPTILAANECAIPRDMVGDVLPIISNENSWKYREPINISDNTRNITSKEVSTRLKHLGYME